MSVVENPIIKPDTHIASIFGVDTIYHMRLIAHKYNVMIDILAREGDKYFSPDKSLPVPEGKAYVLISSPNANLQGFWDIVNAFTVSNREEK